MSAVCNFILNFGKKCPFAVIFVLTWLQFFQTFRHHVLGSRIFVQFVLIPN